MKYAILRFFLRLLKMDTPAQIEWPHIWECPQCDYFKLRSTDDVSMQAIIESHMQTFHG